MVVELLNKGFPDPASSSFISLLIEKLLSCAVCTSWDLRCS